MKSSRSKFFKVFQQDYCLPENINISFWIFLPKNLCSLCTVVLHYISITHISTISHTCIKRLEAKNTSSQSLFSFFEFLFPPFPNRSQMLPTSILAKISPLAHTLIHSLTHTHTDTHSYTHSLTYTHRHTRRVSLISIFRFVFVQAIGLELRSFTSSVHFKQWSLLLTHPPQMWTIVVVAFLFSFLLLPLLLLIRT
jgi:hypothetical protein